MFKLFKNLKPYVLFIIIGVSFVAAQGILELQLPDTLKQIINEGLSLSEDGAPVIDTAVVFRKSAIMLGFAVLASVCALISSYFAAKVAAAFSKDVRRRLFSKVQTFSAAELDSFGTATLINRSTNDITQVQQLVVMLMRVAIFAPVMLIGGTVMAFKTDIRMTAVLLISVPLIAIGAVVMLKVAFPVFKQIQTRTDKLTAVMRENLTGVRVIRAFNREETEKERFDKANKDLTKSLIFAYRIMAVAIPLVMLLMNFTAIGVTFTVARGVTSAGWDPSAVGNMVAVSEYVFHIMFSILVVGMIASMIPRAVVSAGRIQQVLDSEVSIKDNPYAADCPAGGIVEFDNVGLRFAGADKFAVRNISFTAKPGTVTAIIGSTGSGKSTIVNLLPRFYDVTEGSIRVDGVDVRDYNLMQLRAKLGFVPQKALLFTGTIADNLRFQKEDASDEEITAAAKMAEAYDFITKKEDGFDSIVTQGGTNFSGGQKQRLAIARAFVGKPEIYVFDDCFSALDFKTDAKVRQNISQNLKGATVIIIAQRISTVMSADNIIVLDDGNIAMQGRHEELLKKCDVYREIALSQLSEEELGNV